MGNFSKHWWKRKWILFWRNLRVTFTLHTPCDPASTRLDLIMDLRMMMSNVYFDLTMCPARPALSAYIIQSSQLHVGRHGYFPLPLHMGHPGTQSSGNLTQVRELVSDRAPVLALLPVQGMCLVYTRKHTHTQRVFTATISVSLTLLMRQESLREYWRAGKWSTRQKQMWR